MALIKLNEQLKIILPDEKSIVLEDGSGLSPKNMISAMAFVKFLEWVHKNDSLQYYWKLLPDSFKQGSLSKYLRNNKNAEVELRLKSGSMERIKSYSGYLVYENKPVYALSLIVNHYHCDGDQVNALIGQFFNKMMNIK
jgi:D-alanyl-D-alanine carboxypeptidase/D-alanyl-D-alanine-endopeptidase (penicillin-binding protein 4)